MTSVAASPPSRSFAARCLGVLGRGCAAIPYALVALGLRLVMARVFFLSGQAKIDGPRIPIDLGVADLQLIVTLPAEIRDATFQMFATQYARLPIDPVLAAYLFSYAELVLPICLVLGFATRIAALGLLALTALLQLYVLPEMWWAAHVYWAALLSVLVVVGPGGLSMDALLRAIYRRG